MAFQQTTASSIDDVIAQICAFAVANAGFTDQGTNSLGGRRVSKDGIYWTFVPDYSTKGSGNINNNNLLGRMSYSVAPSAHPTNGNGQRQWTAMSCYGFAGPYTNLYLFTEGTAVHAVLELTTRVFNHISFGSIIKTDTFVGGEYISANCYNYRNAATPNIYRFDTGYGSPMFSGDGDQLGTSVPGSRNLSDCNSYIRNIIGAATYYEPDFCEFGTFRNNQGVNTSGIDGVNDFLVRDSLNVATFRNSLLPMYIFLRDPANGLKRISGYIPDFRFINMAYLNAGEVTLNDWQAFPMISKEGNSQSYAVTSNYGFAYKRTA